MLKTRKKEYTGERIKLNDQLLTFIFPCLPKKVDIVETFHFLAEHTQEYISEKSREG